LRLERLAWPGFTDRRRERIEASAALASAAARDYPVGMDTLNKDNGTASGTETEAERQARLVQEAEGIARARASVAAGRVVDSAWVKAWIA
jgi:hypothetical protein